MFELVEKEEHLDLAGQRTLVHMVVSGCPSQAGDHLSEKGLNQIDELARSRLIPAVTRIFSGPEKPVVESAEALRRAFGAPLTVERSLSDILLLKTSALQEIGKLLPRLWTDLDLPSNTGESLNSSLHRIRQFAGTMVDKERGSSLALVVGPTVHVLFDSLVSGGAPMIDEWLQSGHASCTVYEYHRGGWSLVMPAEGSFLSEPTVLQDTLPDSVRKLLHHARP